MSTPALSPDALAAGVSALTDWSVRDGVLARDFTFADFPAAMTFMVHVGFAAEAAGHHPDWTNIYNKVSVRLSTHDAGGAVTQKDLDLAGGDRVIASRRADADWTAGLVSSPIGGR